MAIGIFGWVRQILGTTTAGDDSPRELRSDAAGLQWSRLVGTKSSNGAARELVCDDSGKLTISNTLALTPAVDQGTAAAGTAPWPTLAVCSGGEAAAGLPIARAGAVAGGAAPDPYLAADVSGGRLYGFDVVGNAATGTLYLLAFGIASADPAASRDLTDAATAPIAVLEVPAGKPASWRCPTGRPFTGTLVIVSSTSLHTIVFPAAGQDLAVVVDALTNG